MKRPGVMIYFSLRPALRYLDDQQLGQLLRAILDYAECGETPDFLDPLLAMAWSFVASGIDRDWEAYQDRVAKNQYAVFCREVKRNGKSAPTYDEWETMTEDGRKWYLQSETSPDII